LSLEELVQEQRMSSQDGPTPPNPGAEDDGVLIVGACQAGVQLATSLREFGWTAPITLVGAERHLPYERPPLSKRALLEGVVPADLALRSESFFADQNVELVLGEQVTQVEVAPDGRGSAVTGSGRRLRFRRLALTVGARPRVLDLPGADLRGIHYLRDNDDASLLRSALVDAPEIVVIGGGFIGLEVAATARKLGCAVTVVLADDRLMARAVSPFTSNHFQLAHESHGVGIRCATLPEEFLGDETGRVTGVQLADGAVLTADVVIIGVGAQPRTELAAQLGLTVEGGIVVDEHAVASDGVTVSAGDCTVWPAPGTPRGRMRFESVNAATEQAKVAAATLTGHPRPWSGTPWFWSDQFDLKLQVAGIVPENGETVLRIAPDALGSSVLHYAGDRLVAAECVNRPADFMAAKSALAAGKTIDPSRAADVGVRLKSLIAEPGTPAIETKEEDVA
jgi:3-phenylpropionate/trans-cinnamate dioxygenase ferredoxin reductase subunit